MWPGWVRTWVVALGGGDGQLQGPPVAEWWGSLQVGSGPQGPHLPCDPHPNPKRGSSRGEVLPSPLACWEIASLTFSGFGELLFFTPSKSGATGAGGHGQERGHRRGVSTTAVTPFVTHIARPSRPGHAGV